MFEIKCVNCGTKITIESEKGIKLNLLLSLDDMECCDSTYLVVKDRNKGVK